ncbi:MAG: hypothetical protein QM831_16190 [Kofleriaceae bacterium]
MASVEPTIGDDESFLVFADELIRAGDPRGELIHLDHAIAKARTRELVDARDQLFARFPMLAVPANQHVEWRLGFVDTLGYKFPYRQRRPNSGAPDDEDDLRGIPELFAHPSMRYLRRLILDAENLTQSHLAGMGAILPPTVSVIEIGAPWAGHGGRARFSLTPLLARIAIQELAVSSTITLTQHVPSLRAFTTSTPEPQSLEAIVTAAPNLERITLLGTNRRLDLAGIARLRLVELSLVYIPVDHLELDRIAQITTLRKLRVWNPGMTPELVKTTRERFAHLELDLRDAIASRAP